MSTWSIAPHVAHTGDSNRIALIDLNDLAAKPRILAGSAAAIWCALVDSAGEENVVSTIATEYGIEPSQVRPEVVEFLGSLQQLGVVDRLSC